MAKLKRVGPGEWQQPKRKGYRLGCCDCGLVHTVDFRIVNGHIQMRAWRNERSTAAVRRYMDTEIGPKNPPVK